MMPDKSTGLYPLYRGSAASDSHPKHAGSYSAPDFVDWLRKNRRFSGEKDGHYWMSVSPSGGPALERKADCIGAVSVLGIDVDQGDAWSLVQDRLDGLGLAYAAYPSFNHGRAKNDEPARDRWRVVVFLKEAIAAESYKALYAATADMLVGAGNWDNAASDASRLWYVPFVRNVEGWPEIVDRSDREPFDVFAEVVPSLPAPSPVEAPNDAKDGHGDGKPWECFSRSFDLDALSALLKEDGWHSEKTCPAGLTMTRPGKESGPSATLNRSGNTGPWVYVFSGNAGVPVGGYDAFQYVCKARFNGDFRRAVEWAKKDMDARGVSYPDARPAGGAREAGGSDKASDFVGEILNVILELWRDVDGAAYATLPANGGACHLPLDSRQFSGECSRIFYQARKRAIRREALQSGISTLVAKALHEGNEYSVCRRVGFDGECVYLALHNARGQVVRISCDGWEVVSGGDTPVRFVKTASTRELPTPSVGGSLEQLRPFLNLDPSGWLLAKAFLAGCFLPTGTFPVFVATGEQGSGKSFASRIVREVVDPVKASLRTVPKDVAGFMASLSGGHILAFDNVSKLNQEQSDCLCSIVSGAGFAGRTLYTNAEETVVEARRPIILNGIPDTMGRSDLADRSLVVRFRPLGQDGRKSEADMLREYEKVKAGILGALLDSVSRALAGWLTMPAPDSRLLDFARWALAGSPESERAALKDALAANRSEVKRALLDDDEFAQALMSKLAGTSAERPLRLPVGQLLASLNDGRHPSERLKISPKGAAEHLKRISPNLRAAGFFVKPLPRTNESRCWELFKGVGVEPSLPSQSSQSRNFESEASGKRGDDLGDGSTGPSPDFGHKLNLDSELGDGCDGSDAVCAVSGVLSAVDAERF